LSKASRLCRERKREREREIERVISLTYVKTAMKPGIYGLIVPLMIRGNGGSHGAHIREPIYRLKDEANVLLPHGLIISKTIAAVSPEIMS